MRLSDTLILFGAALMAGAVNSVAGGGSLFSFPALLFVGVAPIPANATSAVALWPGFLASAGAYRKKLPRSVRVLAPLLVASLLGGVVGAGLLVHMPQLTFMRLIPFLFFAATLVFAFSNRLFRTTTSLVGHHARPSWTAIGGVALTQLVLSMYGGFFGGGMSILTLALLAFLPLGGIHGMNGVKSLIGAATSGVAVIVFVLAGIILWREAALMLVGTVLGGYGGANYAQKVSPSRVRTFVIAVGLIMSIYFMWKYR